MKAKIMKAFFGFGLILISLTVLQSYKTQPSDNHDGELSGVFSVSPTRKVKFSQGNLQYCPATETWRFADYQWETIGEANITHGTDSNYNGWLDMFTFLSSGWFDGENINYKPTNRNNSVVKTSPNGKKYNYTGYGPSCDSEKPDDMRYDWGMYNPIINGGNKSKLWRTMTTEEYHYLFFERNVPKTHFSEQCMKHCKRQNGIPSQYYHGFATIVINNREIHGVILLPDNWNATPLNKSYGDALDVLMTKASNTILSQSYTDNIYTYVQWLTMERLGAVFFPATGKLNGNATMIYGNNMELFYNLFPKFDWYLTNEITDNSRDIMNGTKFGLINKSNAIPVRLIKDIN